MLIEKHLNEKNIINYNNITYHLASAFAYKIQTFLEFDQPKYPIEKKREII